MLFETFIARRYLIPRRSSALISIISFISIVGITIGVAALIIILSVFNGFNGIVKDILIGFDPHVRVTPVQTTTLSPDSLLPLITSDPDVVTAAPFVSGRSAIIHNQGIKVIQIRGMRKEDIGSAIGLGNKIISGTFEGRGNSPEHPVVLGTILNNSLRATVGDTLSLLSQTGLEETLTMMSSPKIIRGVITGLYESNNKEYDSYYAYTDMNTARQLFGLTSGTMGIEVRLRKVEMAEAVQKRFVNMLGPEYRIETWQDLHRDLFGVMELERWAAFVILLLIVVVAVFNVLGSLTMTVIQKQRDIGVMKTMGASNASIMRIFVLEGAYIGSAGTIAGLLLGLATCISQQQFGWFTLDTSSYIIPAVPVTIMPLDIALVCFVSLGLALSAAMYPARRAARILPADAVRWE